MIGNIEFVIMATNCLAIRWLILVLVFKIENFKIRMKSNSLKYKLLPMKWCQTREKPGFWHRTFDWLRIMKCPSEIKSFDYSKNLQWLQMEFPLVRCHISKQGFIWLESFKFSFLLFLLAYTWSFHPCTGFHVSEIVYPSQ